MLALSEGCEGDAHHGVNATFYATTSKMKSC